MGFCTASYGKFHDRGLFDILYRINSFDIMGCCTPEHSVTTIVSIMFLLPILGAKSNKQIISERKDESIP